MSKPVEPADTQPRIATVFSHNLSWIAMVVMAGMCLATLVYAAMLNIE
ncbi:MAG: hypothetical protein ACM31D_07310 [Bacteroidota bacterium]